ncbi:Uncharacterised protein [uncultured archaeon]|nr:Uncharacterised protein [uncultured archaeon]
MKISYRNPGVEWLDKVPEHENEATAVFQTGLTGSTGYGFSFYPVHPVILSSINKTQKNVDLIKQKLYYHSTGASQKPMKPKPHTIPNILNAEAKTKPQMNAD